MRSLGDIKSWFSQPNTGTAETAAAPFWRLIPKGVKTVIIRRPVPEVIESLGKIGFDRTTVAPTVAALDRKLDQIVTRVPGALQIDYDELAFPGYCKAIFEHCLPYEFDHAWWEFMKDRNLQAHVPSMVHYARAFAPQIEWVRSAAQAAMLAEIERHRPHDMEGITFQQEQWDKFFKDAQKLLEAQSTTAGTGANFKAKNLALYKMLCKSGLAQITTARCNGRIFGYVINSTGASLDDQDETVGIHLTTFVSKEFPGLGHKLVKASNEALRARDVSEVIYRVGVEQKKLGAFYRRLGAEYRGEEYALKLT